MKNLRRRTKKSRHAAGFSKRREELLLRGVFGGVDSSANGGTGSSTSGGASSSTSVFGGIGRGGSSVSLGGFSRGRGRGGGRRSGGSRRGRGRFFFLAASGDGNGDQGSDQEGLVHGSILVWGSEWCPEVEQTCGEKIKGHTDSEWCRRRLLLVHFRNPASLRS